MGTSQTGLYANVRTLTCVAMDSDTNHKIEHIMKELVDLTITQYA